MSLALKSVGLTLLLVCSTTIALCIPANMGRSPVLAQANTTQDRKAEGDRVLSQFTLALVLVTPIAPAVSLQKRAIEVQLSRLQPDE